MPPSAELIGPSLSRLAWRERAGDRAPGWLQRLIAHVPLRSQVLEIGCGTGELARELAARRGARVTAIDVCPRQIDVARVRTPRTLGIEYCVANICDLVPEGFDVVVSVDTLHTFPHESDRASALAHMAGAVHRGGRVLLADLLDEPSLLGLLFGVGRVRTALRGHMPGAKVRRHLGGRYSAIWQRS